MREGWSQTVRRQFDCDNLEGKICRFVANSLHRSYYCPRELTVCCYYCSFRNICNNVCAVVGEYLHEKRMESENREEEENSV